MKQNLNLLSDLNRVQVPIIKVTIGDNPGYTFGVRQIVKTNIKDKDGFYQLTKDTYPNYVNSLGVTKVNGKVNNYDLTLVYPITPDDDPNFIEKVLSSVNKTRKITFTYGDASLPEYIYKNEEAIITNVDSSIDIANSAITYRIQAVSAIYKANAGTYTFPGGMKKPSDEIKNILYNKKYGLQQLFIGMNNRAVVERNNLIPGDDRVVNLETKTNISILDYLLYLVSCMIPSSSDSASIQQQDIYILTIIDDTTGEYGGNYFKIIKTSKDIDNAEAYQIDVGYMNKDVVLSLNINNNESYAIFYNWQKELNNEEYAYRLNDDGEWEKEYAPLVSSKNEHYRTRIEDKTWWTKITEYPISLTIRIRGLLRPAILMNYVRLNVLFFGKKYIASGLYVVTKQQDSIDSNGYYTTLALTRIKGDRDLYDN